MDYPLEEEIVDDRTMSTLRVYQGCALELFHEKYIKDFFHIPLRGKRIIVGMDWLSQIRAIVNCDQ